MTAARWLLVHSGALLLASCAVDNPPRPVGLDEPYFRCRVEPVLVASCAFYACHGTPERAFRIYAPNRLRLDVTEAQRALALTDAEHAANFRAALRFAEPSDGYDQPLLVQKPLDVAAGGAFHRGATDYGGGDVFVDESDDALVTLRDWALGAMEDPSCVP